MGYLLSVCMSSYQLILLFYYYDFVAGLADGIFAEKRALSLSLSPSPSPSLSLSLLLSLSLSLSQAYTLAIVQYIQYTLCHVLLSSNCTCPV